jgi:hypothetical protein
MKHTYSFIDEEINEFIPSSESYLIHLDEFDFYLLSKMNIMVCANSSFALWSSYISDAELICIPDRWFVPNDPYVDISLLTLPSKKYMIISHKNEI